MKKLIITIFVFIIHYSLLINHCYAQWQPDVRLTNDPAESLTSYNWCIASSGLVVHVVWQDFRDGANNSEIYYKRSTDGGVSWGADTRLTNNAGNSYNPSVAVSGSVVHVVWHDIRDANFEIYYKRSTDGGVSWGADIRLTNNFAPSYYPSVAVSGSAVHVVWHDSRDGNNQIYYKLSTDGGTSWGADTRLTNNSTISQYPSVSVSGQVVHLVWEDRRDGNPEIYYKRSTDGGSSWGADTRLTNNSAASLFPSVSVSGEVVHVVWNDERHGNYEIYYKRSTDGGTSWGADTRLTNDPYSSEFPSVAVSGSAVHVVWHDSRDGSTEIYYKRSTDGGVNWGADTRLTNNSAFSGYSSVAVSGSAVHVVWYDFRDGNNEIYYKRDPTGNMSTLPVLDLRLAGTWRNNAAVLNWTTAAEYDNDHFDIERRYPRENNFSKISSVRTKYADGNSQSLTSYGYTDATAGAGEVMILYRLKQVDKNGQYIYSNTISIRPDAKKEFILNVYPTIATGSHLFIQAGNLDLKKIQAQVFDINGRLLTDQQLPYQSQLLPLPVMGSGMYRLVIQSGEWKYSRMFVK